MWSRDKAQRESDKAKNDEIAAKMEAAKWHAIAMAYRDKAKSNDVDGQSNWTAQRYREDLFKIVQGCFDVTWSDGMSDEWDMGYILDGLTRGGVLAVCNKYPYGISIWQCGVSGLVPPYKPERAVIANQWWEGDLVIGKECEIIYLNPFPRFFNYNDFVDVYAQKLASCDAGIDVNIFNSKLAYAFFPETQKQAKRWETIYNKISNGCPAVFIKDGATVGANDFKGQLVFNNLSNNFIATDIQTAKRMILNEFYTRLSINNVAAEKKERLVTGEVDVNNTELLANTETIQMYLDICCKKVNKMFPGVNLSIKYKWRDQLKREVDANVSQSEQL